jgi:hypothetical protein
MTFGMTISTFTSVHVVLSLVGILSGFVVLFGLLGGKRLDGWTALFLASTVATNVTGFLFPVDHFLPSHAVGIISLVILAVAILARYALHLAGAWRWIYVVGAVRAAIPDHTARGDGALRRAWYCRGEKVPQPDSPDGLTSPFSNSKDGVTMVLRDRA